MPSLKTLLTLIAILIMLATCPACGESDQASKNVRLLRFRFQDVGTQYSYGRSTGPACMGYSYDREYYYSTHTKPGDIKKIDLLVSGEPYYYVDDETQLEAFFFQSTGAEGIAGLADSLCREAFTIAKKHPQAKQLYFEVWFREQGPLDADIQRIMEKLYSDRSKQLGSITFRNLDQIRQCASADEYSAKMNKLVSANIRVAFENLRVFKDY